MLDDVSKCIETIYASIVHPDLLPDCYDSIARLLGGIGTVLIPVENSTLFAPYVSGNLAASDIEYREKWWWRDPGVEAARRLGRPLGIYATEDIVDAETMRTHPHYTDFGPRHGFRYFLSMTIAPLPGVYLILSVQRKPDAGPVSDEERRIAAILREHLVRSMSLRYQVEHLNQMAAAIFEKLEHSVNGMALINADGHVVYTNEAMKQLEASGLFVAEGRIALEKPASQRVLDTLLTSCQARVPLPEGATKYVATLAARGGLPLIARCSAFSLPVTVEKSLLNDQRDFTILTIVDPNVDLQAPPLEELGALGLTTRQALLAALVGTGRKPQDIAEQLGISRETVRTHLKIIFEKLGVKSQNQLSVLLAKLR